MAAPPFPPVNIVVGTAGAQPTPPATIWQQLLTYLQAIDSGYTILPGLLIEDILSTDVAAIAECDSAAVELINSLTPNTANAWILYKLGQIYGVTPGLDTNTEVFVQFSGAPGYVIERGFLVSDGTYQYAVQEGGAIGTDGNSGLIFCVATQSGTWPVLANTVTQVVTSVQIAYAVTVTNPEPGIAGQAAQTVEDYRAQVLQAGLASAQGMATFLKTLLARVPGVQTRLVSVVQIDSGGWEVIVGGGDPYAVAFAIYQALFDISALVGSTIRITGITNANPGVVTTNLNPGFTTGQNNVHIADVVGMTGVNGGPYTVTVLSPNTFSFGVDTTGSGAYVSGGEVTPNDRNVTVDIIDYPDTYAIPIVLPPAQTTEVQLTWNTDSPNFVSAAAVEQFGAPAIAAYVNSIPVGQPLNIFQMEQAFAASLAGILQPQYISRMDWTVSINGVSTPPVTDTFLVEGDPESYFTCALSGVVLTQG